MTKKDVAYIARLDALAERLTDVVLDEANPDNWSGGNKQMAKLTKDERGSRYWDKKNAAATLTVLVKVHSLIDLNARTNGGKAIKQAEDEEAEDLAKQINAAEKEAMKIIERVAATKH